MRSPRARNFNGHLPVPRVWLKEGRGLSDRAFRLHLILAAYADWDARHSNFTHVKLTHPDLAEVMERNWSRATFSRAINALCAAGYLKRLADGEYQVLNLQGFLTGKARERLVAPAKHAVAPGRQSGSPMKHAVAPGKQKSKSPVEVSGAKNLNNLKKESTGAAGHGDLSQCDLFPYGKRAIAVDVHSGANFEDAWQHYHALLKARDFDCELQRCRAVPTELARVAVQKATNSPAGYLKKSLLEYLEKETDTRSKSKEANRLRLPTETTRTESAAEIGVSVASW